MAIVTAGFFSGCAHDDDEPFEPTKEVVLQPSLSTFILNGVNSPRKKDLKDILLQLEKENLSFSDFMIHFERQCNQRNIQLSQYFLLSPYALDVKPNDNNTTVVEKLRRSYSISFEKTIYFLEKRLKNFTDQPFAVKPVDDNIITIQINDSLDHPTFYKFLNMKSSIEFWKVFENTETLEILQDINHLLQKKMYPETSSDSINLYATVEDNNPLLSKINITYNSRTDDYEALQYISKLIFVSVQDQNEVEKLLQESDYQQLYPDLVFKWGLPSEQNSDMIYLYALKKSPQWNHGGPLLTASAIKSAVTTNSIERQENQVEIQMTPTGTEYWEEITEQNIQKQIAIVINGVVFSAPIVNEPIRDGVTVVSGVFQSDLHKSMVNLINASLVPLQLTILEVRPIAE